MTPIMNPLAGFKIIIMYVYNVHYGSAINWFCLLTVLFSLIIIDIIEFLL